MSFLKTISCKLLMTPASIGWLSDEVFGRNSDESQFHVSIDMARGIIDQQYFNFLIPSSGLGLLKFGLTGRD